MEKYLITTPSRFNKNITVHNYTCRYYRSVYGEYVEKKDIPQGAVNCKVCGGKR